MKTTLRFSFALTLFALLFGSHSPARAQGTAFTYQGQLTSGGQAANGSYDMAFSLYEAATGGAQVGNTVTNFATGVTNGMFAVTLDFGSTPFNGQALWLQIAVSPAGLNAMITLSPLQPLTSIPYAVTASNVTGSVTLQQLPNTVVVNGETNVSIAGAFSGDGSGLTNLNASQLTGTLNQAQIPGNVLTIALGFNPQTNVYASAGIYTVTVPAGATQMVAKLWGASGGGAGGGGAFVEDVLPVVSGQVFNLVVGQHGDYGDNNGGGAGSGDAQGGNGDDEGGYYEGQGGQASSLFYNTNGSYIMQAVAGGGGGGYYGNAGAGGNPGQTEQFGGSGGANGTGGSGFSADGHTGGSGGNYAADANTVGIAALALAGGNGGDGVDFGCGGGGGYGGGGGASLYDGGGGGSYGQIIIGGTNGAAGNTQDPNYIAPAGSGNSYANGNDGLVVIIFPGPGSHVTVPGSVTATVFAGDGSSLTNLPSANLVGTISNSQLESDVALLDQSPVFTTRVTVTNGLRLNDSPIYLRAGTDTNHGLVYAGNGKTNFGTNQPDGPVLWGYTGGTLGALSTGSPTAILSWNASGVTINGALAAGSFSGNGHGLSNLAVSPGELPGIVVTNTETGVTLTGTFSGNGGGLTGLNGAQVTGTLANPISTTGTVSANLFSGNGRGLTNLQVTNLVGSIQSSNLAGGISYAQLPSNVVASSPYLLTNVISLAGVSNLVVPPGVTQMVVKLWGAGGGGGYRACT